MSIISTKKGKAIMALTIGRNMVTTDAVQRHSKQNRAQQKKRNLSVSPLVARKKSYRTEGKNPEECRLLGVQLREFQVKNQLSGERLADLLDVPRSRTLPYRWMAGDIPTHRMAKIRALILDAAGQVRTIEPEPEFAGRAL